MYRGRHPCRVASVVADSRCCVFVVVLFLLLLLFLSYFPIHVAAVDGTGIVAAPPVARDSPLSASG